jgi:thiol-disulfide isomerase/thioredoxin
MRYLLIIIALWQLGEGSIFAQNTAGIPEVDFRKIEPLLHNNNDTTYVINFWATWCKPCVEELPGFLKAAAELKDNPVSFVFVSLDFPVQKTSKLIPFVEKHDMYGSVLLLNDPDSNRWIPKVDAGWSGAIPATLIYKGDDRSFYQKSLSYNELLSIIKTK